MPSIQGQMLGLLSADTHFVFKTVFSYQQVRGFSATNQPFCYIKGDQAEITDDLEEHRK